MGFVGREKYSSKRILLTIVHDRRKFSGLDVQESPAELVGNEETKNGGAAGH